MSETRWWERQVSVGHVVNLLYKHVRHVGDRGEMFRALGVCRFIGYHWDRPACEHCGHPSVPLSGEHLELPQCAQDGDDAGSESKDDKGGP